MGSSKIFKIFGGALERMNAYLAAHNMRFSPVREVVLEQACLLPQPFTAAQLVEACLSERISQGTVYNCLQLFVEAQILHANERQRGRAAIEYEIITGNQIRMQVICQKCGRVSSFRDPAIERIVRERKYSNFNLQHFTLYVYGECRRCKQKKSDQ